MQQFLVRRRLLLPPPPRLLLRWLLLVVLLLLLLHRWSLWVRLSRSRRKSTSYSHFHCLCQLSDCHWLPHENSFWRLRTATIICVVVPRVEGVSNTTSLAKATVLASICERVNNHVPVAVATTEGPA